MDQNVTNLNVIRAHDGVTGLQIFTRDGCSNRRLQKVIGGGEGVEGAPSHADIAGTVAEVALYRAIIRRIAGAAFELRGWSLFQAHVGVVPE